jgi:hypothetical protein
VNFDEDGHSPRSVHACECEDSIEMRTLPSPEGSNPTALFFEALYTLASLIVTLPAYLAMSVALALAFYIRCAGVLLSPEAD